MTASNFERALALVLRHEGGYVNHPNDPGGPTNKGITLATMRRYVMRSATVDDLKAITPQQVATVYRRHYWDAVRGDELPSGVDYALFDFAVNSGPSRAIRFMQRSLGVEQDGKLGPATMRAVKDAAPGILAASVCDLRLGWLKTLKTWQTFGKGWASRVNDVKRTALAWSQSPTTTQPAQDARKPVPAPVTPAKPEPAPAKPDAGKAGPLAAAAAAIGLALAAAWAWLGEAACKLLPFICN